MLRLLVAFLVLNEVASVVNKDVQRTVDASSAIVKIYIDIKAADVGKEYNLVFPTDQAKHLAFISVTRKGKDLSIAAPVQSGNHTIFAVAVNDANPTLKVEAVFTDMLEPYPAEITQGETQLVRFTDSHYFLSPYPTESQKTTVKLASSGIESFTKLAPHAAKGSTITFGPYKDIPALSYSAATMHYVNNKPFAKFSTVNREMEVSHWGNIAVEEIYELKHHGAKLKGGFSRFDYMMKRTGPSPSYRSLIGTLPLQANNIYYRDQIGNISTSYLRNGDGELELEIETRFPMFGGWQTQFYIGYSIPTEVALFVDSDTGRHNLKFDFFTLFEDVWVEDMEIKVVLPEGATDIKVDVPYPVEQSWTRRFTYLDSQFNGGRPVLTLKAKNIVEEHDKQVVISYSFQRARMVVEPMLLVGSFFAMFVVASILARIQDQKKATKQTK